MLLFYRSLHAGWQTVQTDKAGGIGLLIAATCIKGGNVLTIQGLGGPYTGIDEISFI